MSRRLIDIIKDACNFNVKYSIKNSYEVVEKHCVHLRQNAKFISLNAENLFPSISPSNTIELVSNQLNNSNVNVNQII